MQTTTDLVVFYLFGATYVLIFLTGIAFGGWAIHRHVIRGRTPFLPVGLPDPPKPVPPLTLVPLQVRRKDPDGR